MVLESLTSVKVLGSILICVFGCLGSSAPVVAHHSSKRSVKLAHCLGFVQQLLLALGAGVVLATALVHILPEGVESLADGGLGEEPEKEHVHNGNSSTHSNSIELWAPGPPSSKFSKLRKLFRGSGGGSERRRKRKLRSQQSHGNTDNKQAMFSLASSLEADNAAAVDGPLFLDNATLATIASTLNAQHAKGAMVSADALKSLLMAATAPTAQSSSSFSSSNKGLTPIGSDDAKSGSVVEVADHNAALDDDDDDDHQADDQGGDDDDDDEPYPYAYVFVLAGVALTFVVESELHRLAGKAQGATLKVHLVEAGIAVHSVLVGVAFGTLQSSHSAQTLMIALVFHQLCEGFALGPLIHKGSKTILHSAILVLIFGISTPIGVVIGVLIDAYSDPHSKEAQLSQGILMLVACGLLLYVGCVEFLAGLQHDVEHQAHEVEHDHKKKVTRRRNKKLLKAAVEVITRNSFTASMVTDGSPNGLVAGSPDGVNGSVGSSNNNPMGTAANQISQQILAAAKVNSPSAGADDADESANDDGTAARTSFMKTWGPDARRGGHKSSSTVAENTRLLSSNAASAEGTVVPVGYGADHHQSEYSSDGEEEEVEEEEGRQIEAMKQDFLSLHPKTARIATYVMFYVGAGIMSVIALWV